MKSNTMFEIVKVISFSLRNRLVHFLPHKNETFSLFCIKMTGERRVECACGVLVVLYTPHNFLLPQRPRHRRPEVTTYCTTCKKSGRRDVLFSKSTNYLLKLSTVLSMPLHQELLRKLIFTQNNVHNWRLYDYIMYDVCKH